jgi:hypothetical protein
MREGFIVIGDVQLLALCFLYIGDPTCTFNAYRVTSLAMNKMLSNICGIELFLL